MELLFFAIVALVPLLAMKSLFSKPSKGTKQGPPPYTYQLTPLLSNAERSFYSVLTQAVDGQYLVMAKVRIADILTPTKGQYNRSDWQRAFNAIAKKHVDFVLCDPQTLAVMAVVELNDRSHHQASTKQRDALVASAYLSAQLPLITIAAKRTYRIRDVQRAIAQGIKDITLTEDV